MSATFFSNAVKSVFLVKCSCTSFVNLSKSIETVDHFRISNLSTSVFNAVKLDFKANEDASTCVIDFKSSFAANPSKSLFTVTCFIPDNLDE